MDDAKAKDLRGIRYETKERLRKYCAENGIRIISEPVGGYYFVFDADENTLCLNDKITEKQIDVFIEWHEEKVKNAA